MCKLEIRFRFYPRIFGLPHIYFAIGFFGAPLFPYICSSHRNNYRSLWATVKSFFVSSAEAMEHIVVEIERIVTINR